MSANNFNFDDLDDFDEESKKMFLELKSSESLLNFDDIQKSKIDKNHPLNQVKNNFENRSNEVALNSPFRKDSIFYIPKRGTLRAFLTDKHLYEKAKFRFNNIDLETINITVGKFLNTPETLKKM